jgi:hypothetical protein
VSRDRDMEAIWCGEFERLQALIAKDGGNIEIKAAKPVGAVPIKIIKDLGSNEAPGEAVMSRNLRS